jgi:serine/threonine-protein kinase ULK4
MDKYHIYEEIGKGEFSQVFKGREKKKIEYVAIKRVEKGMMNKVVNEVQVMHKMDSPHTLRFHDWYETRNNLWLILEYCTGSDLETLVRQDGHLPEQSVKTFGMDMLAGLKYMHSMGILHCDVRPRNFLVDEYGILKISDFKMARKVPKTALGDLPLEQRGTPEYMAPELFLPEGLHSYASDFWSLGCVLYELRRGQPPFGDDGMPRDQLLKNIREKEPIHDPLPRYRQREEGNYINTNRPGSGGSSSKNRGSSAIKSKGNSSRRRDDDDDDDDKRLPSMTAKLADLVLWCIEKQPGRRGDWVQISAHPFWGKKDANEVPGNLPAENAYYLLVKSMEHQSHMEQEESLMREFQLTREQATEIVKRSASGQLASDRNSSGGANHNRLGATPAGKPQRPHVSDSTPVRPAEKPERGPSVGGESQRVESISENYSHSNNNNNTAAASPHGNNSQAKRLAQGDVGESKAQTPVAGVYGESVAVAAATGTPGSVASRSEAKGAPAGNDLSAFADDNAAAAVTAAAAAADSVSKHQSQHSTAPSHNHSGRPYTGSGSTRSNTKALAESLLVHKADTAVKPIVGNKAIESIEKVPFKPAALPFPTPDVTELAGYSNDDIEMHLTRIYKALQRVGTQEAARATSRGASREAVDGSGSDRTQILGYLMSIGSHADVANIVLNTNFLHLLLRLLRGGKGGSGAGATGSARPSSREAVVASNRDTTGVVSASTRAVAVTLLATVLRYATYVQCPSAKHKDDHILPTLVGIMKEDGTSSTAGSRSAAAAGTSSGSSRTDAKIRRRCMAALGEVLFYIGSQDEGEEAAWTVPPGTIGCVVRCLRDESDEALRHYAAKTVENIMAQGSSEHKRKFVTVDIASRLLELSQHGRNEVMQASCGMALSHMFLFVMTLDPVEKSADNNTNGSTPGSGSKRAAIPPSNGKAAANNNISNNNATAPGASSRFMLKVLDRGGLPAILETLNDGQPKLQQAYLNVINLLFASREQVVRWYRKRQQATGQGGDHDMDDDDMSAMDTSTDPFGDTPVSVSILDRGRSAAAGEEDLRSVRGYFLRAPGLAAAIVRLAEQGGSAAVRAKAILAAQLMGAHSTPLLAVFAEKRLPGLLVKLIETATDVDAAAGSDGHRPSSGGAGSGSSSAYPAEAAYSFVSFARTHAVRALEELRAQMLLLCQHDGRAMYMGIDGAAAGAGAGTGVGGAVNVTLFDDILSPGVESPSKRRIGSAADRTRAGTRNGPRPSPGQQQVVGGRGSTPGSAAGVDGGSNNSSCPNLQSVQSLAAVVKAAATLATRPQLRRMLLVASPAFVRALTLLLHELHAFRSHLQRMTGTASLAENVEDAFLSQATLALDEVDAVVVTVLECLGLVDVQGLLQQSGVDSGSSSVALFVRALSGLLGTAAATLMQHGDGAVRVIVTTTLRKLYPATLSFLSATVHDAVILQSLLAHPISQLFSVLPAMLQDGAPVPLYSIRLLSDLAMLAKTPSSSSDGNNGSNNKKSSLLRDALKNEIVSPSLVGRLVALFRAQFSSNGSAGTSNENQNQQQDEDDADEDVRDPHLVLLLRSMCEVNQGACTRLLELSFASDLAGAIKSVVSRAMGTRTMQRGQGLLSGPVLSVLVPLIDLCYFLLHFSFRAASAVSKQGGDNRDIAAELAVYSQRCRSLTSPLSGLSASLLAVIAAPALDDGGASAAEAVVGRGMLTSSMDGGLSGILAAATDSIPQLRDNCSRSLGIIFDLYPDSVADAILSGGGTASAISAGASDSEFYEEVRRRGDTSQRGKSAVELLSAALTYEGGGTGAAGSTGLSLRIRLLKILAGVCSLAGAMGVQDKVQRLILSAPLVDALEECALERERDDTTTDHAEQKDSNSRPSSSHGTRSLLSKHAQNVLMAAKTQ